MNMQVDPNLARELEKRNYGNAFPLEEMLDIFTFVKDGNYFHTADGRFARVWRLPGICDEAMHDEEKASAADALAYAFNRFPENSCGQFIRYTHNNINYFLNEFYEDISDSAFSEEIINATIDRQLKGAKSGFFGDVSTSMLNKAKQDLIEEIDDSDERKDDMDVSINRTMSSGRYATTSDILLVFIYSPPWASGAKLLQRWYQKLLAGLGFLNLKELYFNQYKREKKKFLRHADYIEQALLASGIGPRVVTGQGMIEMLYRELNPDRSQRIKAPTYKSKFSIREFLDDVINNSTAERKERSIRSSATYSSIHTSEKGWQIGDNYYAACSAKHLPTSTRAGMLLDAVRKVEGRGWVVCNFHVGSQVGTRALLKMRKGALWSKANLNSHMPMFKPDMEQIGKQQADMDYVTNAMNPEERNTQLVLNASYHAVMINDNPEEAQLRAQDLEEYMWQEGYFEAERGDAVIHHCLPMNMRKSSQNMLQRKIPTLSANFADMCPLFTSYQGMFTNDPDRRKTSVLVNNSVGEPTFINVFHERVTCGHALVAGSTGSGKSFMANTILSQMRASDKMKIFIVDKGDSYQSFCQTNGGTYVKLMLDDEDGVEPVCLNPLYTGFENGKRRQPDKAELEFIQGTIEAMALSSVSKDNGVNTDLTTEDLGTMLKALTELYNTHPEHLEVTLTDYCDYLVEHEGERGRSIAAQMFKYTRKGLYGKLFDGPLKADWTADIIVFETDKLADSDCLPIAMLVLFYQMEMYSKHILGKSVRKVLAIDEAWAALAQESIASIIAGYFREMRKHNMAIWLLSQSVEDFARLVAKSVGDSGKQSGIIQNTKHFFLLSCSNTDHGIGKELLNMTDEDVNTWASVSSLPPYYSEVYYRAMLDDDKPYSGKFRVMSNSVGIWIGTTTPVDVDLRRKRIKEKINEGLDPQSAQREAILELAKEFPYGSRYAA